jgi:formate-dependent nitrite reductase cytochrome c552 subunit
MVKSSDFDSENSGSSPDAAASPPPPLCVWCSAPWTDDMLKVSADVEMYHGYYGDSNVDRVDAVIDITCSTCKRLVYRKELRDVSYSGGY